MQQFYGGYVVANVAERPPAYIEHIVVEGQSYTIPCGTTIEDTVRWFFDPLTTVGKFEGLVYDQGRFWGRFETRFSLNTSLPLLYGLDILNVELSDAGIYTCIDDHGEGRKHIHNLSVQGKCRP